MILLEKKVNNKRFFFVENSIIEEKVEAIVNPANERLIHGGGVAGLISRTGGPDIQRESNQKAPVKTGESTHTTSGKLPFKYIIHTVGPIWRGGSQGEEDLLKSAVWSALKQAEELQINSISMPSISTGIFGYPLEPAIKTIVQTIFDFMETESHIKEIHLCEFSEKKALEIKGIIESHF
jgi:O-acetyl-ADP-ribose deacetylase (regulator of RNase III)